VYQRITLNPLPAQRAFLFDDIRHSAFVGGYGSGKTYIGCHKCLRYAALNRGCYGMYTAPTYRMMRDILWRTFEDVLNKNFINYKLHKSEWRLELPDYKSSILLRSTDNPSSLEGVNLGWAGMDEASLSSIKAWQTLLARTRDRRSKVRQVFLTTTPEGFNWIYDEFVEKKRRTTYKIHYSPTTDNHYLPDDYVDSLRESYDPKLISQYIKGEFVNVGTGAVYFEFDRDTHIKETALDANKILHIGIDFNVCPMLAEAFQITSTDNNGYFIHGIDELYIPDNASTLKLAGMIKERFKASYEAGKIWLYPDAAGGARKTSGKSDHIILREELPKAVFKQANSNPRVKDRINAFNRCLRDANGTVGISISPRQNELKKDLEQVVYGDNGTINKTQDARRTHASDAAGYVIEKLRPAKKPAFSI